jgi:hypothetical protein
VRANLRARQRRRVVFHLQPVFLILQVVESVVVVDDAAQRGREERKVSQSTA